MRMVPGLDYSSVHTIVFFSRYFITWPNSSLKNNERAAKYHGGVKNTRQHGAM
ncbi:hypothetical protein DAI22_06g238903 [Oryza sativa Japonica Group]|nr:hypothetical protein DAI22_06g238903 [Oryza sativa Japonica Group]